MKTGLLLTATCVIVFSCHNKPADPQQPVITVADTRRTLDAPEVDTPVRPIVIAAPVPQAASLLPVEHPASPLAIPDTCIGLSDIDKTSQTFTFTQQADTVFHCKEGTLLAVKRGSFATREQETVTGPIIIQVKEYYTAADMITARLSTLASGAILETGGTLFIAAYAGQAECTLKEGNTVEISFPHTTKKDSMTVFAGEWSNGNINWSEQEIPFRQDTEQGATYPGGKLSLQRFWHKHLRHPGSSPDSDAAGMVAIELTIDETGKVTDATVKNKAQRLFRAAVLKACAAMPRWEPARRNGIPVTSTVTQTIIFATEKLESYSEADKDLFESTMNDTTVHEAKASEIGYYVLSTSKLGWINCDRFYRDKKPKIDYLVRVSDFSDLEIKLIFHSFKAILSGEAVTAGVLFKGVSTDEQVTVVAVKRSNNTNYIALLETNTSTPMVDGLPFEKVTMQELKNKLQRLSF